MLKSNLLSEDATLESTLPTQDNAALSVPVKGKKPKKLTRSRLAASNLNTRDCEDFDPFDPRSVYDHRRSRLDRWIGYLKNDSLRTGAIGIITATLGTGVLALPNGIAHYGWATGTIALLISGLCQYLSYIILGYAQSMVSFPSLIPPCRSLRVKHTPKLFQEFLAPFGVKSLW